MRSSRTLIRVIILLILFTAVGYTISRTLFYNDYNAVNPDDLAPDFTLTTLDGLKLKLSDTKGKGVILNFWGTYCPPCVTEMPLIEEKSMSTG
ncbi:MAG: redoxin domain-containing protein [Paenibacillaceae bacterium]